MKAGDLANFDYDALCHIHESGDSYLDAVLLTRRDDPEWPMRLKFVYLPLASALGAHPRLTMAPHLAERLGAKTLTDPADC